MPRLDAVATSMLSTPAPARMTRLRPAPARSASPLTRIAPGFKLARASNPAHEIDPLILPLIPDTEQGAEDPVVQEGDVERADGVGPIDGPRIELQEIPSPRQVQAKGPRTRRPGV